ncbi:MAG: tetratricopeptide repeat protein [Magnetospirillum sp.]|nr:tetratricopeptide repeat protein [Magnetospirillum sp.]
MAPRRDELFHQALTLHQAGNLPGAELIYRKVAAKAPRHGEALRFLALVCFQQQRYDEAAEWASKATEAAPDSAEAWNALGNTLAAIGRFDDAARAFARMVDLMPEAPVSYLNLGIALRQGGRLEQAVEAFEAVLKLQPDNADALNSLGSVLHDLRRPDEAGKAFRAALAVAPNHPEALRNLGIQAREDGAVAEADRCLAKVPGAGARILRATLLPAIVADEAAIDECRTAYRTNLDALTTMSQRVADPLVEIGQLPQFYLGYHGRDDRPLQELLSKVLRRACPGLDFTAPHCRPGAWQPGRRLRVGVVSRHLHDHTIGRLFIPLLAGLPREAIELVVLALPSPHDAMAAEIAAAADVYIRLPAVFGAAREAIAEAALDVLLYPDIGMEPFSYFLAHARLAPVQMVSLGHPVTTGIPTVDAFLSAAAFEPADGEAHYGERLLRLPAPPLRFRAPPAAAGMSREDFGFDAAMRVYLCPQTLFKLHPAFDAVLADILRRDPAAIVALIANRPSWRAALEARFAATIPDVAGRIGFLKPMPRPDFLALCAAADVVLDVPQFSGGNSTLETLAMGTPVVTLPTGFMRGRVTAGLLGSAGLERLIATAAAAYAAMAVAVAADPQPWRREVAARAGVLFDRADASLALAAALAAAVEERRG